MSYGWLTEASTLPRKSKQIKVDDSGVVSIKAAILESKGKRQETAKKQISTIKVNPGVKQRIQKDQRQSERIKNKEGNQSYISLLGKTKVYNKLSEQSRNHGSLLVDFTIKEGEDDQYETSRKEFYEGKLSDLKRQRQKAHQTIQIIGSGEKDLRERLNWQKEVLDELKGQKQEHRPKVAQSFDNKLTREEKQALYQVRNQKTDEILKIQQIRKKRQEMELERIRKLRKLNIIKQ